MNRKGLSFIIAGLFLAASDVRAEEVLTWQRAVEETLANNSEILAARERMNAADAQIGSAQSGYYPQLSGSLNYQKSHTTNPSVTSSSPGSNNGTQSGENYGATLTLSQNLFNGFQDDARVNQARAQYSKSEAAYRTTLAKIGADLKNAFAAVLYAQNLIKLQETIAERRQNNSHLVGLRFKSGRENRGSLLLAQAYSKQAVLDLLSAKNTAVTAQTDLNRVVGRELGTPTLKADVPFTKITGTQPDFRDLASAIPQTKDAEAERRAAEAALTLAQGGHFPTLALSASTGKQGRDWFPESDRWSVGASLTIPLFNGGKDYYSVRNASSSLQAARAALDNVTRNNITQMQQAYNVYVEATEKLKVDQSFREATVLRAEIARSKYNNGLMSFEDWDLVESDLITREKSVLQSERDKIRTEAQWMQIQGLGVNP